MARRKNKHPLTDPPGVGIALDPNVTPPKEADPYDRATLWQTAAEADREAEVRAATRVADGSLTQELPPRSAAARREVPLTVVESANPRKDRTFPPTDVVRQPLSSNRQKDYSKSKQVWWQGVPRTRRLALHRAVGKRESLEQLNEALHHTLGRRSDLPPSVRRRISDLDRCVAEFEERNERTHVVYAVLRSPAGTEGSREKVLNHLKDLREEGGVLQFDGYIPGTHSLGNIPPGEEVVMEIRTRSGVYLGTSDSTPNTDHLIGRGRSLRPVAIETVQYVDTGGTQRTRRVVQMEDVSPTTSPTTRK